MSHIHIDVKDLSFSYDGNRTILDRVSFHAGESESVGIIGMNGAGKSTLLKLLVGLELSFSGSIRVEEIPLEKKKLSRIREKMAPSASV